MQPESRQTQSPQPAVDFEPAIVDAIVSRHGSDRKAVIPILQAIQRQYRYLPQQALQHVCDITEITPADIAGVATFYSQFRHHPVGQHIISVCHGTACHVKKAQTVSDFLHRELNIGVDADTDAAKMFTVEKVACLGCCSLAPVMQIDGITYGHLDTPEIIRGALRDFLLQSQQLAGKANAKAAVLPAEAQGEIRICTDSCCQAAGAQEVYAALQQTVAELEIQAMVKNVSCVLMCNQIPLIEVCAPGQPPALYARVRPADVTAIIRRHFKPRSITKKLKLALSHGIDQLLTDSAWQPVTRYYVDYRDQPLAEFFGPQKHIALENYGQSQPLDLDEYIENRGFEAFRQCLARAPADVIATVRQSGLRGRGGAGFATGLKWEIVRKAQGEVKYIICNGDEGDPGAFMDRMLLETFPYRVLEGIAIAAYAVGAAHGYIYIRAEYPLALKVIREALQRCTARGYFGDNIFGSGYNLKLQVMEAAGAFVCGEETALIASIEGRRGIPRLRPPYPAQSGLWGMPTCVNNVETYAVVPWLMRHGADKFSAIGTQSSSGTKVFALAGKIERGGLIEVPMGTTIRQIVEQIGGGIPNGRKFKAVQIGGPSGGCIPAQLADTPIDYCELQAHGAIMGSGGLVVLDDADCMVDVARYFLEFTQDQSCGKCTFCRIGTRRMLEIMNRFCSGEGRLPDIAELERLGQWITKGSLCALGQTAPNPVLTTLRFFRDEYVAHVDGRCPAGKCVNLIKYVITDQCIGCTRCAQQCPPEAIEMRPYKKHAIDSAKCTRCDACRSVCPVAAIRIE